jgi:hypothetical protein
MGTLLIDKLLQTVVTQRASDLHLTVGSPPVLRLHGHMRPLATKVLESADTTALMKSITPERCQQELQEVGGTDFGFAFGDMARFRVAVFKQRGNIGLVLRRIPNEFLTFQQLGLPPIIEELIKRPRGLILVTGPTGSGKTTSLASMINYLNQNWQTLIDMFAPGQTLTLPVACQRQSFSLPAGLGMTPVYIADQGGPMGGRNDANCDSKDQPANVTATITGFSLIPRPPDSIASRRRPMARRRLRRRS